jgi:hypothetical protein
MASLIPQLRSDVDPKTAVDSQEADVEGDVVGPGRR